MKFIESYELREWVKDNLRKTVFQKAHALAVQTGCEILVKMHDNNDINGCQFYATNNLKQMYKSSKLQQPGEALVSGETGLPPTDRCICGADASEGIPGSGDGGGDMQSGLSGMGAVPMQLSSTDLNSQTQNDENDDSDIEITQITNPQNLLAQSAQIKQEPHEQQQNPMYGQSQQMGDQSMMGNQGMMGSQQPVLGNYHAPIHVTPKPYQCSICRKAFKSVHVLQKHTLTFHTPGGAASMRRGRGRGSRGSRGSRGRGSGGGRSLKMTISKTQLQQYQAMPTIKTENSAASGQDPNSTTFEQQDQLQAQQQDLNQFADPNSSGSMDASGLPTEFPPSASQDDPATSQIDTSWQESFMPPDGSSPSGLNLPSASSLFGQQNTPISMYSTPTQSPRASGSGGSGSRAGKLQQLRSQGHLRQNGNMTKRNVMAAILQTTGPVSTHRVVRLNWKFLRMLSAKQFLMAAQDLEKLGLGLLLSSFGSGKLSVFVKKAPSYVETFLSDNKDLCSLEHYTDRYFQPPSKILSTKVKNKLIADGIVPQHLLSSVSVNLNSD